MFAHRSGEAVVNLLKRGITARDILTREAFENAIAVTMAASERRMRSVQEAGRSHAGRT